jgi:hypothetical protein
MKSRADWADATGASAANTAAEAATVARRRKRIGWDIVILLRCAKKI